MHYILKYSTPLLLIILLFSSCRKEPKYGDAPEIEFKGIEQYTYPASGVLTDSLVLVIGFRDGNGNLGLNPLTQGKTEVDDQPPFNDGSPYQNNFIVRLLIKNAQGQFEEYQFPVAGFDKSGRFPRISNDDREEPLEGNIKYSILLTEDLFDPGDVLKFEVFIYDRTLPTPLKSNVVTTSEVTLFQK